MKVESKHTGCIGPNYQLYDRWVRAASGGQLSGGVLLDLSAAFDLVDPQLLLQKLKLYGAGREQEVWIDLSLSDFGDALAEIL